MGDYEKYKKWIRIAVVFMILVIILLSWRVAKLLVSVMSFNIGDHVRVIRVESEDNSDTGDVYEDDTEELDLVYKDEVYDSTDIEERGDKFLSGLGDRYKSIITHIKNDYSAVFAEIYSTEEREDYENDYTEFSKYWGYGNIDLKDLVTNYRTFVIKDSLTAIGFFDNTYVIYAYDYPIGNAIVVMDYEDVLFSKEGYESDFDYGDTNNMYVESNFAKVLEYDDFTVLFAKGMR